MSLSSRIKERREELKISRNDLASIIGVTPSAIANYEYGISTPKIEILYKLFNALDCDANYLYQDEMESKSLEDNIKISKTELSHIKKYRSLDDRGKKNVDTLLDNEYEYLLSIQDQPQDTEHAYMIHENRLYMTSYDYGASAGTGNYLDEWDIPKSTISVPDTPATRKADFVLRVVGDSMEPDYHDGDRVLVKSQDSVSLNDIAIYIIDGESYIKQYKGSYLHSLNPAYDDIQMNDGQVIKCVGKVLGKL